MEKLNIVIASDSFKGSLSSNEVAEAMIAGFKRVTENIEYNVFEIADGGEGTVEAVTNTSNGKLLEFDVLDVFRKDTKAILGVLDDDTCILETASPCGLDKLDADNLDPMNATSFGLGQMILHALDNGFKKIYIGLGGSSVNDGGIGLAKALGADILNLEGLPVSDGALGLKEVETINLNKLDKRIKNTQFILLSDVKNYLIGDDGATAIYGPQKGIEAQDVNVIDSWMENYGQKLSEAINKDIINTESAGAAGGIGAALIALTNAEVKSGIEAVIEILDIEDSIKEADIVFTGEGRIDGQSLNGKAPLGISKIAQKYNKPVIAIVGSKSDDYESVLDYGIDAVFDIVDRPMELKEAIENGSKLVENAAYAALRLYISWKEKLKK